jgi:4-alpha-glucanotransferase
LAAARHNHGNRAASHQFRQFLFARQWSALRHYARQRGVKFIGDAPIFVAGDSADVWSNPELFLLDSNRRPTVVAGVPPDYFSATGQLWGNPLYDWDAMRRHGYGWWTARLKAILAQVDLVRLDHFRGFAAAWHVPNGHKTAEHGTWIPGPGADLFSRLRAELGGLPFIAEDLGLITEDVEQLRLAFGLPGMAILQFAFGSGSTNKYLPHNFVPLSAVYTGTHDNDTTRGWYSNTSEKERDHVRRYLGRDCSDVAWDLIRLAWQSVADFAITPLQDLMNLGSEARMNSPGNPIGNWCWRFAENALTSAIFNGLEELTVVYGRESN